MYKIAAINWLHFCILLFLISIATIVAISLFTKKPGTEQVEYTFSAATPEDRAITRAGISKWDIINSIVIIGIVVAFYIYFW